MTRTGRTEGRGFWADLLRYVTGGESDGSDAVVPPGESSDDRYEIAKGSPEVPLPKLSAGLKDDVAYPPLNALGQRIDLEKLAAIVKKFEGAQRIAVVGHVPADADTYGSALGLGRLLAALGKDVTICVDAEIPTDLRRFDRDGEIQRADALEGKDFDLAVVVDVAAARRVGGAKQVLGEVDEVVVLDHHEVECTPEKMAMKPGANLTTMIDPTRNATGMLVAAITEMMIGDGDSKLWRKIAPPILGAILQDTERFRRNTAQPETLRVFKHIVRKHFDGKTVDLVKQMHFSAPDNVRQLLRPEMRPKIPEGHDELSARLESLRARGIGYSTAKHGDLTLHGCPKEVFDLALDLARIDEPEAVPGDIWGLLMSRIDAGVRDDGFVSLVLETEAGVNVSFRSEDEGPAQQFAKELGGNGRKTVAGAQPDLSYEDTMESVVRIATDAAAEKATLQLRLRSSAS